MCRSSSSKEQLVNPNTINQIIAAQDEYTKDATDAFTTLGTALNTAQSTRDSVIYSALQDEIDAAMAAARDGTVVNPTPVLSAVPTSVPVVGNANVATTQVGTVVSNADTTEVPSSGKDVISTVSPVADGSLDETKIGEALNFLHNRGTSNPANTNSVPTSNITSPTEEATVAPPVVDKEGRPAGGAY
jgi:hypothetical protein